MVEKVSQIKAGVALNYVSIGIHALVTFLYTPYMLHKLGQSEYGLYSLVASVVGYLTLMDFGFGDALVRYTAKYRAEGNADAQCELFGMFSVFYFFIAVFVSLGGLVLYWNVPFLFGDTMTPIELERAKVMMLLMTFNLAISFCFQIYGSIINAYERFVFSKTFSIIRYGLNTVLMVLLLHVGYKAIAMVVVTTFFNIFTLFVNYVYCRQKLGIHVKLGKFDKSLVREISLYSFLIFLNAIMDKIYWSTGQFVLGTVSGTVAVSIFALAIHLEGVFMVFSLAISGVFLPKVTGMVALKKSDREISDLFIRTGRIQFLVLAFIMSGFIVFGHTFICLWAGEAYAKSYYIAVLFYISLLAPLIQNMGITILKARNQMMFRSVLCIVIAMFSLIAQIILSRYYGALGCAVAISFALFIGQGLIMNIYYHKVQHLDIAKFWKEIGDMAIVPLILTVVGCMIVRSVPLDSWLSLITGMALFSVIYLPLFWRYAMSKNERELLVMPVRRIVRL